MLYLHSIFGKKIPEIAQKLRVSARIKNIVQNYQNNTCITHIPK
jgi:hypothetical protein